MSQRSSEQSVMKIRKEKIVAGISTVDRNFILISAVYLNVDRASLQCRMLTVKQSTQRFVS